MRLSLLVVLVVAALWLNGCSLIPVIVSEPEVAASEIFVQRCDRELEVAVQLQAELEDARPPYTPATVLKPYNQLTMLLEDLEGDARLYADVHPDSAFRTAASSCQLEVRAARRHIHLSPKLYDVLGNIDMTGANNLTRRFVRMTRDKFEGAGVLRRHHYRTRLAQLGRQMDSLEQMYKYNIRQHEAALRAVSVEDLTGLPAEYVERSLSESPHTAYVGTNDYLPFITYAENASARRDLARLHGNRGWPENRAVLKNLLGKRHEYARILGYDNFADYRLSDQMAQSSVVVAKFLDRLADQLQESSEEQYRALLSLKQLDKPGATEVYDWEKRYYAERFRKEHYGVDGKVVRQYFGYRETRDALFQLTDRLFGLQIRPWKAEAWHATIEAYELLDGQRVIGRFYLDMQPREGKTERVGNYSLRVGVLNRQVPVGVLVANFPGISDPLARLEHDQVLMFVEEFGQILHRLLSGRFEWAELMNMETDFGRVTSSLLTEWFWDPGFVRSFAKSVEGYAIPMSLLEKMNEARFTTAALAAREELYQAALSLYAHTYAPESIDFDQFMTAMKNQYSSFQFQDGLHQWAGIYDLSDNGALGYHRLWSAVVAAEIFAEFEREGLFDTRLADRYRFALMEAGGSQPATAMVKEFLGRSFETTAFLRRVKGRQH